MNQRLTELVREIHRRSLWQVLGVYLVGSWVALQVVQTLTSSLGLPDWLPALAVALLVVGLPVVVATAIVQERPEAASATAVAPGSEPSSGPLTAPTAGRRWLTWRNALGGGVLAFALWGLVAAGSLVLEFGGDEGPAAPSVRSIAVLPLDNFTGDAAQQYLADGLHEALIHELAKIEALLVKSRTSVARYRASQASVPEIAAQLGGVDRVVEGSVFQLPGTDSLRITVQLIDPNDDGHLWSRDFWGTLGEVRALQGRVAGSIAEEIRVTVTPEEATRIESGSTVAPEAVELYMRARGAWRSGSPEELGRSIELYERALQIEPEYALAWAGLADAHLVLAHLRLPAHDAFPKAREAAARALELDDGLAQAHTALADARFHYEWEWRAAERGFRRATELAPGYDTARWWYSGLLAALGRMDEAVDQITRARELDPLSPQAHGFAVRILYYARRYEEAIETVRQIRELGVDDFMTTPWLALSHHELGDTDRALATLEAVPPEGRNPYVISALVRVLSAAGRTEEARRHLATLEAAYGAGRLHLPHLVALGHASLGDHDRTLDWLETAAEDRDGALPWVAVEPAFDALEAEPRFGALLERMGLAPVAPART